MFRYFTKFLVVFILIGGFSSTVLADFYVIPVVKKVPSIVHVAPSGGDFNNPIDAMNSITDASAENPYLIKLDAGTYELLGDQLVIKPYVSIVGAGPSATTIRGGNGYYTRYDLEASSVVVAGNNTTISSLKIQSYNTSNSSVALYCGDANVTLENLQITKSAAATYARGVALENSYVNAKNITVNMSQTTNSSYSISLDDASTLLATDLNITDTSPTSQKSVGVLVTNGCYADISNSFLNLSGGGQENSAITVSTASKIAVSDTIIDVSNGQSGNYGIVTYVDAIAMLNTVAITASDTNSMAINRISNSRISVINSSLKGGTYFARTDSGYPLPILNSQLDGSDSSGVVCLACTDENSYELDSSCNPMLPKLKSTTH